MAKAGKADPRAVSDVDKQIGNRIRARRKEMGLSQESLADAVGVTFQQIQKYERGVNRVGASRLFDLSRVLDVPISFFFDDMPGDASAQTLGAAEAPSVSPQRAHRCCSRGRPAPARMCWRVPCTRRVLSSRVLSCLSIALPCRAISWQASCSATPKELLPARAVAGEG